MIYLSETPLRRGYMPGEWISTRDVEPVFVECVGSEGRWRKAIFWSAIFGLGAVREETFALIKHEHSEKGTDWRHELTHWMPFEVPQVLAGDKP